MYQKNFKESLKVICDSPLFGGPVGSDVVLTGNLCDVKITAALYAAQLDAFSGFKEKDGGVEQGHRQFPTVVAIGCAYNWNSESSD